MRVKQKVHIPKLNPNCDLDSTVIYFGNKEDIQRYKDEETRIFTEWKYMLKDILHGRISCISIDYPHTVCTLSSGLERKETVRYSSFFKKQDGQLDAILHHEYSEMELNDLIQTYLFEISKDDNIVSADIIEELSKEWEVVPECDMEETGEHTQWARQVDKKKWWWIDKVKDGFEIVDSSQNILHKCKTFGNAKRWADREIENEYYETVIDENEEYRLIDVGEEEYELHDVDGNLITTTSCETIDEVLDELQNQSDLSI